MRSEQRYQIAKRATLVNSTINALLACLKVILGLIGNSQALVADGVHSFSDLITDGLVLVASKVGTSAPDKEHPYGHQRIETVASILISLVLIGVAVGIAWDTLIPILGKHPTTKPEIVVIIIAGVSIFANEFLFHYTMRQGNLANSDLLRANAWHNRSDSLISIIVLVSVIGARLGANYLDAIGALIIALLILKMSLKMIYKNLRELIDTGVEQKLTAQINQFILSVPGVESVHQLRTRSHGSNILLDVHIEVNSKISVSEGHYISEQVNIGLIKQFDNIIDVTVHIDPEDDEQFILSKDLPNRDLIQQDLKQCWSRLAQFERIDKLTLHYLNGKITAEIFFPLTILKSVNPEKLAEQYRQACSDMTYLEHVELFFK